MPAWALALGGGVLGSQPLNTDAPTPLPVSGQSKSHPCPLGTPPSSPGRQPASHMPAHVMPPSVWPCPVRGWAEEQWAGRSQA